ncbi:hypothetical protein [Cryptosporangium sp. NPDC048952]|uniref:hypothetical protein n=1 Tax=Cryptosporangium sp. NPDC048952 TaxID=3363961 RepID=UPI003710F77F
MLSRSISPRSWPRWWRRAVLLVAHDLVAGLRSVSDSIEFGTSLVSFTRSDPTA